MAEWTIETDADRTRKEQKYRTKYGDEGYEDRKATARAKADELEKAGHWQEAMFYAPQFEGIAMTASEKIWPRLSKLSATFWMRLFQKIAPCTITSTCGSARVTRFNHPGLSVTLR